MAEQRYRAVVKHPLGGQYVWAHTVADTVSEAGQLVVYQAEGNA
jgi:hypothetical protein